MPTTAGGIRYPSSAASINIPGDLQNLAEDVETYITANAVTTSGTYTLTNKTLTSPIVTGDGVVFEGATADSFETTLTVVDPTADRTVTIPNATTTLVGTDTTQTLTNKTLDSPTFTGQVTGLELAFAQSIVFEGTTADSFETTLTAGEPTADRVLTLPNATGTIATTADIAAGIAGGVTETGTQTLTNKTLTSPVLGGTTTTASGNLAVQPATYILEVKGSASTEGAIQLNCAVNSHGQIIKSQPHGVSATNTLLLPGGSTIGNANATLVSDAGTQTLTNKTIPELVALEIAVIMAAF